MVFPQCPEAPPVRSSAPRRSGAIFFSFNHFQVFLDKYYTNVVTLVVILSRYTGRSTLVRRRDENSVTVNPLECALPKTRGSKFLGLPSCEKVSGNRFRINTCKSVTKQMTLTRDYVLDTKSAPCYAFLVRFFLASAATFLMCLTTFGWNKCSISSSLVMCFGCFFFGMGAL